MRPAAIDGVGLRLRVAPMGNGGRGDGRHGRRSFDSVPKPREKCHRISATGERESELPTLDVQRRVLVVLADGAVRTDLVTRLVRVGYAVQARESLEGLHELVLSWRPEVLVLGETYARGTGRQALLSLRASGRAFPVPVVAVQEDVSVPDVLRWLRVGCVEVWRHPWTRDAAPRVKTLIDECTEVARADGGPAHAAPRLRATRRPVTRHWCSTSASTRTRWRRRRASCSAAACGPSSPDVGCARAAAAVRE
jgi:CheY-like chemotaxis protein